MKESKRLEIVTARNVLFRGKLIITCGKWEISEREKTGEYALRKEDEAWKTLTIEEEVEGEVRITYRIGAGGTGEDGFKLDMNARKDPCRPCSRPDPEDELTACMFGEWRLASGGLGEQIERMIDGVGGLQNVDYPELEGILILKPDGRFIVRTDDEGHIEARTRDGDVYFSDINLQIERQGYWTVDGGKLNQCYDAEVDIGIEDEVTTPDGVTDTVSLSQFLGPRQNMTTTKRVTCVPGRLELKEGGFFGPRTNWVYTK